MIWWIRVLSFFVSCFFLLPLINVEDPFRSLALRFFSKPLTASIYSHECTPDRTYRFQYTLEGTIYQQRYDAYIEDLDMKIPEDIRCSGQLSSPVDVPIRYFPFFKYWSEPEEAIRSSLFLFFLMNFIKVASVFLLIVTFIRKSTSS